MWNKGQTWKGHKLRAGSLRQSAQLSIAGALETAARRSKKIGHLITFTDAQAAIWRVTSDYPGPGQKYAVAAGNIPPNSAVGDQKSRSRSGGGPATAKLRKTRRPTNWQSWQPTNQSGVVPMPEPVRTQTHAPEIAAHLKRQFSEAKWTEARGLPRAQLVRTRTQVPAQQQMEAGPTCGSSPQAARLEFYQLKIRHCLTGQYL